jgi:hypothetical protein
MNIKNQFTEFIGRKPDFAFVDFGGMRSIAFNNRIVDFISAKNMSEAKRHAKMAMGKIAEFHGKGGVMGATLTALDNYELFQRYSFKKKQRRHFTHLLNVFLLGLYLYHNSEFIRSRILGEIERTNVDIPINNLNSEGSYRYSEGTPFGEFLYRWRLASLSHDFGYGVSLSGNKADRIKGYLNDIPTAQFDEIGFGRINTVEELYLYRDIDLLDKLNNAIDILSLRDYWDYQSNNPQFGKVYYDHGIISALIFLRLMHEEFGRHNEQISQGENGGWIIWDKRLLDGPILQMAVAIAMHNLDQYPEAVFYSVRQKNISGGIREVSELDMHIYNINDHPLIGLLKLADLLQEWDKIKVRVPATDPLPKTDMQISFHADKIIASDFPENKIMEISLKILRGCIPNEIVLFE